VMFSLEWQDIINFFRGEPIKPVSHPIPTAQINPTDRFSDTEIVARTLYGEARGESHLGKIGVASVILNRSRIGGWWGKTPRDVCLAHFQFSSWNANDPNRSLLLGSLNDAVYDECLQIAEEVMSGTLKDNTNGADSYCVTGLRTSWNSALEPCAVVGHHSFYKTIKE